MASLLFLEWLKKGETRQSVSVKVIPSFTTASASYKKSLITQEGQELRWSAVSKKPFQHPVYSSLR